jgi:hypothetical protein
MSDFSFELPQDFAEYEWEVEAKGWFPDAKLVVTGKTYRLNFYEPVRLSQEVASELERGKAFFEPNLLIVRSVTRAHMIQAAEQLMQAGQLSSLVPD